MQCLRSLGRLRRGLSARNWRVQQRWAQSEAESKDVVKSFDKRTYDAQKYGGLKSVDTLFSPPRRETVVGRWDWHLVHFLLALVPSGAVVLLVNWARQDMAKKQLEKNEQAAEDMARMMESAQRLRDQRAAAAAQQGSPAAAAAKAAAERHESQAPERPRDETQELKARLSELEATVKAMAAMQRPGDAAPPAAVAAGAAPPAQASVAREGEAPNHPAEAVATPVLPPPPAAAAAASATPPAGPSSSPAISGPPAAAGQKPGQPPPLPKLPDNPLDRWLPETDCQFCNDTRQRLWGAFKRTTGYKSAYDRVHEGEQRAQEGAGTAAPAGAAGSGPASRKAQAAAPEAAAPAAALAVPASSSPHLQQEEPALEAVEPVELHQEAGAGTAVAAQLDAAAAPRPPAAAAAGEALPVEGVQPAATADAASSRNTEEGGSTNSSSSSSSSAEAQLGSADLPAAAPLAAAGPSAPAAQHKPGQPPPLPKLPDNPLDRWLPETDCQFCNDTRQKLWGAFKHTTGFKSAHDRVHAQDKAPQQASGTPAADGGSPGQ